MVAVLNLKGSNIGVLDAAVATGYQGMPRLTGGEGAKADLAQLEDMAALSVDFLGAVGNYCRLLRFPNRARVKKVEVWSDGALDSNAASTLKLNFGVAFSDSYSSRGFMDGTPKDYDSLVPTNVFDGTTTTFAAYANPNDLYGSVTQGNNVAIPLTEITFNGAQTTYNGLELVQNPLVELFGILDGRGDKLAEMGYFDLYAYVATVAATPAAGNLYARVQLTDE